MDVAKREDALLDKIGSLLAERQNENDLIYTILAVHYHAANDDFKTMIRGIYQILGRSGVD